MMPNPSITTTSVEKRIAVFRRSVFITLTTPFLFQVCRHSIPLCLLTMRLLREEMGKVNYLNYAQLVIARQVPVKASSIQSSKS